MYPVVLFWGFADRGSNTWTGETFPWATILWRLYAYVECWSTWLCVSSGGGFLSVSKTEEAPNTGASNTIFCHSFFLRKKNP